MEMDKKTNYKFSNLNPSCIKERNLNSINIFDTSLKNKKSSINGFNMATKLKRNFK